MRNAAVFGQLFRSGEIDACNTGAKTTGVNTKDECTRVIVAVIFFIEFFNDCDYFFFLSSAFFKNAGKKLLKPFVVLIV